MTTMMTSPTWGEIVMAVTPARARVSITSSGA